MTVCCWFSDSAIKVPASEHFDNIVVYSVVYIVIRCCDDIGFYLSVVMYKCITQRTRINFYRQYWKRQLFFLFKRKQCFVRVISLLLTPPEERKWLPEWPVVVDSIQHVLWHQQDNDWLTSSDKNTWFTLCSLNYRRKKRKDKLSAGPWLASLG